MTYRALDLFCGSGGMSLGLQAAGFEVIAGVDNWAPAAETYRKNFHHTFLERDISSFGLSDLHSADIDPRSVDVVVGGPPCQGFSIQRIGRDEDDRNNLVLQFARIVAEISPKSFVMENVPGLLGKRGTQLSAEFAELLSRAGYDVHKQILDAASYGVPQLRRRVFFVGTRRDLGLKFAFPIPTHKEDEYRSVRSAIADLPSPPDDFTAAPGDPLHRRMRISQLNLQRLALIPPGGGFEDLPPEMRVPCHRNGASKIGHRNVYGRLAPDRPSSTITARFDSFTRGRFAHPWENRNITLREGARLQGIPDDHCFFGTQEEIAAQIGNSVPPPLAAAVFHEVAHALGGTSQDDELQPRLPFAEAS